MRAGPNGHLHLAIVLAFLLCIAVALAVPISRSTSQNDGGPFPLSGAGAKLAQALGMERGPLTAAITSNALGADGDEAYTEAITPLLVVNLIPEPLLAMTGEVMGDDVPGMAAITGPTSTFTVHEEGLTISYSSTAEMVGEALSEVGVSIGPGDLVYPGPETDLRAGSHIFIDHATTVRLTVGGEEKEVHTQAETVEGLLEEQAVGLEGADFVMPPVGLHLRDGMDVRVTVVREVTEYTDDPVPFGTVYTYDRSVPAGTHVLKQEGKNGHLRREFRVLRVDGEKARAELVEETLSRPQDRIFAIGTYIDPASASVVEIEPGEEIVCSRTLDVWATWYTASTSGGSGITRTGTGVYKGIIATDPNVIPLGTRMFVPGYGFGIAADTGGGIKGNKIDLGFGETDVKDWPTGWANICIIG